MGLWDFGFRGLGFRVSGLGFRAHANREHSLTTGVYMLPVRDSGLRVLASLRSLGFRVRIHEQSVERKH